MKEKQKKEEKKYSLLFQNMKRREREYEHFVFSSYFSTAVFERIQQYKKLRNQLLQMKKEYTYTPFSDSLSFQKERTEKRMKEYGRKIRTLSHRRDFARLHSSHFSTSSSVECENSTEENPLLIQEWNFYFSQLREIRSQLRKIHTEKEKILLLSDEIKLFSRKIRRLKSLYRVVRSGGAMNPDQSRLVGKEFPFLKGKDFSFIILQKFIKVASLRSREATALKRLSQL